MFVVTFPAIYLLHFLKGSLICLKFYDCGKMSKFNSILKNRIEGPSMRGHIRCKNIWFQLPRKVMVGSDDVNGSTLSLPPVNNMSAATQEEMRKAISEKSKLKEGRNKLSLLLWIFLSGESDSSLKLRCIHCTTQPTG